MQKTKNNSNNNNIANKFKITLIYLFNKKYSLRPFYVDTSYNYLPKNYEITVNFVLYFKHS